MGIAINDGCLMGIRFEDIRQDHGGPNLGFEELVCQIARRMPPAGATEYRRIEGAGGDGGVEAYWKKANGSKVGYQAKYFLRVKNIDWNQIDKSVRQALKSHPELSEYQVAIACDLTGKSGEKGRGKSGWEHWETWKAKWDELTQKDGLSVAFVPITANEIIDTLIKPEFSGLRAYWFERPFVGQEWFNKKFEDTCADLDERYHPEDHVELEIGSLFDALARSDALWSRLFAEAEQALNPKELRERCRSLKDKNIDALIHQIDVLPGAIRLLTEMKEFPISQDLDLRNFSQAIQDGKKANEDLKSELRSILERSGSKKDAQYRLARNAYDAAYSWEYQSRALTRSLSDGDFFRCERTRVLLVVGEAGVGKSHLIADALSRQITAHSPAIMLLGQHIRSDLEQSFATLLDLNNYSFDTVLQTLNCAAEVYRQRCVIAIDAINESPDLTIWRNQLSSFLTKILRYSNLAVALSCRPEYVDALLPNNVRQLAVLVTHRGFTTPEEQDQAAIQYIEKRGIARPATPWLNPEFTNPLFLRTCTTAMQEAGMTTFPRGLRGSSRILSFYLEQLEKRLIGLNPGEEFPGKFIQLIARKIVALMITSGQDSLRRQEIEQVFVETLGSRLSLSQAPWLKVLCSEGLFRKDHEIDFDAKGGLTKTEEVFRFSYQRFFDLLAVDQVLTSCSSASEVFAPESPFHSLLDVSDRHALGQRYFGALAIGIPEKFHGEEIVDVLNAVDSSFNGFYLMWEAFSKSLRWRDVSAFSSRTFELFDDLPDQYGDPRFAILMELSVVEKHPLNADCLHQFLLPVPMPDRDAIWSIALAFVTNNEEDELWSALDRLIEWCQSADKSKATDEVLRLAATSLCWLFSTSSRPIRDRATKALTSVIRARPGIAAGLIRTFSQIDDLYVPERVYAAIYSAVCFGIDPVQEKEICKATWELVFSNNHPPLNILLRDYALGILEHADFYSCLPDEVEMEIARPPYTSSWPLPEPTEDELEAIAEAAGDKEIFFSAGDQGDFARYEIEPRFGRFTNVLLSEPRPMTDRERRERFNEILLDWEPQKVVAYRKLEDEIRKNQERQLGIRLVAAKARIGDGAAGDVSDAESVSMDSMLEAFKRSLSSQELSLFMEFGLSDFVDKHDDGIPEFDSVFARRWVAKRAYEYGWTKDRFPREPSDYNDRRRPLIERIGKKYQWLAESELVATCADNLWVRKYWPETARIYANACDVEFVRDIEPTVFPSDVPRGESDHAWWKPFSIAYDEASETEIALWPFSPDDIPGGQDVISVSSPDSEKWFVLKSFYSFNERHESDQVMTPFRRSAFVRVSSFIVSADEAEIVKKKMSNRSYVDPTDWEHVDVTDGPFFREFPWRDTWSDTFSDMRVDRIRSLPEFKIARPVMEHRWESHLDASLLDGAECAMPSTWLAAGMSLIPSAVKYGEFIGPDGDVLFMDPSVSRAGSVVGLVKQEAFLEFLQAKGLQCIWVVAGEKSSSPNPTRETFGERQYTRILTHKDDKWASTKLYADDHRRGLSGYDPSLSDKRRF